MDTQNPRFLHEHKANLITILHKLSNLSSNQPKDIQKILRRHPKPPSGFYSKAELWYAYTYWQSQLEYSSQQQQNLHQHLQTNQTRTISGVTPVTVFTKPFPCPGQCIFCPNDVRMPKSYLSAEPGAQRAMRNKFDPYAQTYNRLVAFQKNGHPTSKVELIILGGTWTAYTPEYQRWFIKRCFDALNDFQNHQLNQPINPATEIPFDPDKLTEINGSDLKKTYNRVVSLALIPKQQQAAQQTATDVQVAKAQCQNETAQARCVGLVIETRPDEIDQTTVINLRKLGATKIQIGFQSLNDQVLAKNHRGHDVRTTRLAVNTIRQSGFKIQAHWMPNLYGSNPKLDKLDYKKLFHDPDFKPDELKIYPCSLIATAELMAYYQAGLWKPYSSRQLSSVLSYCLTHTPPYCRLSRVIRDISSDDIITGNKTTNLREIIQNKLQKQGKKLADIRAREIRKQHYYHRDLKTHSIKYQTSVSTEYFIQIIVKPQQKRSLKFAPLAGFLRLSVPTIPPFIDELVDSAIIRELHVYGPSIPIGDIETQKTQHHGLGKKLILQAIKITKKHQLAKLSVISAIGTREYYRKLGFSDGILYQHHSLRKQRGT